MSICRSEALFSSYKDAPGTAESLIQVSRPKSGTQAHPTTTTIFCHSTTRHLGAVTTAVTSHLTAVSACSPVSAVIPILRGVRRRGRPANSTDQLAPETLPCNQRQFAKPTSTCNNFYHISLYQHTNLKI